MTLQAVTVAAVVAKIKIKRGCDSSWSLTWLKTALTTCHSQVDSIDASYLLGSGYAYGNTGYTNGTFTISSQLLAMLRQYRAEGV